MDYLTPYCATQSIGPGNHLFTTFISSIIALHCNISSSVKWPKDYGRVARDKGLDDYDFIVIGSGSAGSVVAGRLAENPNHRVLLLEAGGNPPIETEIPGLSWSTLFTKIDWQYPTEATSPCLGVRSGMCMWNKGKVIGGSHSINAMAHIRGNARDYDEWVLAGNSGWGWHDVLPYFRKTEDFQPRDVYNQHGKDGPMSVDSYTVAQLDRYLIMKAVRDLGYNEVDDFVNGNDIGFGQYFGTLKDGRRMSTAKAFLTERLPNLHVIKHAIATKIDFDHDLRADSVSFVYKRKYEMKAKARKEIIVSAGAVETPKLLMLSGIGPKAHLNALNIPVIVDLPVGNNLKDHIRLDLFFRYSSLKDKTKRFLDAFYDQWVHREGEYGGPIIDINGFISTRGDKDYPDIQYLFAPVMNISDSTAGLKDSIRQSLIRQVGPNDRVFGAYVVLLRPKSKGSIRLRSSNYKDYPIIDPNYYDRSYDVRTMIRGIYKLLELETTSTFTNVRGGFMRIDLPDCDVYGYRSVKYWMCYMKYMSATTNHAAGTAKMGPKKDKTTVISSNLKVHGVQGLRVIDASVMPNIVSANINPATIMIAEKGVDLVRSDWG